MDWMNCIKPNYESSYCEYSGTSNLISNGEQKQILSREVQP